MAVSLKVKQLIADKCLKHCSFPHHGCIDFRFSRILSVCQVKILNSSCILCESFPICGSCRNYSSQSYTQLPRLSPQEVTNILREKEYTQDFNFPGAVKSFDSNQLSSNNPIEDVRLEARGLASPVSGMFLGVFDGHGGPACAQVIAKRLFDYITVCMLPQDQLRKCVALLENNEALKHLEFYNNRVHLLEELNALYLNSLKMFVKELVVSESTSQGFQMNHVMEKAFLRLDNDLSREALQEQDYSMEEKTFSVAMSGAVACVAHVDGPHVHVASAGDCQCVLGVLSDVNTWYAKKLSSEHNTENPAEIDRILKEHPPNEKDTVIRMDRLLGQLAPLRAFGDFRYKWGKDLLNEIVKPRLGDSAIPPHYFTPPYLTARPEVNYHRLTPRDKFLILASDGLWDLISPLQAVRLVGEHMSGKVTLRPFTLPRKDMTLSEINSMLLQRKEGLKKKPMDSNAATHLIRNALGGTEYGIDHGKISQLLSLPSEVVRLFRDDITITVIYFDSDYLRRCPV